MKPPRETQRKLNGSGYLRLVLKDREATLVSVCLVAFLLLPVSCGPQPASFENEPKTGNSSSGPHLNNEFIQVSFDLQARTFSVHDRKSGEPLLTASHIPVQMEEGAELTLHRKEPLADFMRGRGQRIILALTDYGLYRYATHFRTGRPAQRLLSFTLYEDHPALILGFGLLTPNYYSMRLHDAEVLSGVGGELFGGAKIQSPLTLNGGAGAAATHVQPGLDRVSSNSLMLTGKVRGEQRTVVWGGLGQAAYGKVARLEKGIPSLRAEDPIGVLIISPKIPSTWT